MRYVGSCVVIGSMVGDQLRGRGCGSCRLVVGLWDTAHILSLSKLAILKRPNLRLRMDLMGGKAVVCLNLLSMIPSSFVSSS